MAMLQVAFAGTFSATLEPTVRARLGMPCAVILADEIGIVSQLSDVDVLITLAFTREMGAAAKRLKLVQVPGAGLDRIDRGALPAGGLGEPVGGGLVAAGALAGAGGKDARHPRLWSDRAGPGPARARVRHGGPFTSWSTCS